MKELHKQIAINCIIALSLGLVFGLLFYGILMASVNAI